MIIAGNGPELPTIERLARAFEKGHLGSVVEIKEQIDVARRALSRLNKSAIRMAYIVRLP
jgi:hypothetical protein